MADPNYMYKSFSPAEFNAMSKLADVMAKAMISATKPPPGYETGTDEQKVMYMFTVGMAVDFLLEAMPESIYRMYEAARAIRLAMENSTGDGTATVVVPEGKTQAQVTFTPADVSETKH